MYLTWSLQIAFRFFAMSDPKLPIGVSTATPDPWRG